MTECGAEVEQSDNMYEMRAQEQRMTEARQLQNMAV